MRNQAIKSASFFSPYLSAK